jgi:hypothetical protein
VLRLVARVRFLDVVVLKGMQCLYDLQGTHPCPGTKTFDNVNPDDLELMT